MRPQNISRFPLSELIMLYMQHTEKRERTKNMRNKLFHILFALSNCLSTFRLFFLYLFIFCTIGHLLILYSFFKDSTEKFEKYYRILRAPIKCKSMSVKIFYNLVYFTCDY